MNFTNNLTHCRNEFNLMWVVPVALPTCLNNSNNTDMSSVFFLCILYLCKICHLVVSVNIIVVVGVYVAF